MRSKSKKPVGGVCSKSTFSISISICIYSGNWGVEGAVCKILELWGQHPQRNNLSKSATFKPILQRPHSVIGEISSAFPVNVNAVQSNDIKVCSWSLSLSMARICTQ